MSANEMFASMRDEAAAALAELEAKLPAARALVLMTKRAAVDVDLAVDTFRKRVMAAVRDGESISTVMRDAIAAIEETTKVPNAAWRRAHEELRTLTHQIEDLQLGITQLDRALDTRPPRERTTVLPAPKRPEFPSYDPIVLPSGAHAITPAEKHDVA